MTDRPWTSAGERQVVYLTALLGGQLSGILEGALICDPIYGIAGLTGDAEFWDTVACGAWLGSAAGIACGIAMVSTRNLGARLLLAAMAGTALFTLVLGLIFAGHAPGHWEGDGLRRGWTLLDRPIGWGLYLGSAWSATATLVLHLGRRCRGKPRLMLGAILLAILVGARSQSFFWKEWAYLHALSATCFSYTVVEYPAAPSGGVCALTGMTAAILVGLAASRFKLKNLSVVLGLIIAANAFFLVWAVRAMPFTSASRITDLTFSDDDQELMTVHEGNTIRLWECSDDHAPIEIGRWRFTKPSRWHQPLAVRYPLAACLGENGVQLWRLPEMRRVGFIRLEGEDWDGLAFSPDGSILAASRPGEILPFRLSLDESRLDVSPGVPAKFGTPAFPGSLGRCFSISDAGVVRLDNRRRRLVNLTEDGWAGGTQILATLRDGTSILGQLHRQRTYIWNAGRPGSQIVLSPAVTELLIGVLSRDDRYLLLMSGSDRWVIDLERAEVLRHEPWTDPSPELIQSSPNDRWIAVAREDRVETWKWPPREASR
jgi:hypothetical protein